ncbi:MAG: sensor histidine kinase [bacterium]|nr:sensor histidine kinase [bacterium]
MFIWGYLLGASAASAQSTLILTDQTRSVASNPFLELLGSTDAELKLVQAQQLDPVPWPDPLDLGTVSLGYRSRPVWLHLRVNNQGTRRHWLFEQAHWTTSTLDLYQVGPGGEVTHQLSGSSLPYDQRPFDHRHLVFPLSFEAGTTYDLYFRAQSLYPLEFQTFIWNPKSFVSHVGVTEGLLMLFFGMLLAMLAFNLLVQLVVPDRVYLLYVAYVANMGLFLAVLDGVALQYLWPKWPVWNLWAMPFFVSTASTAAILFAQRFLRTLERAPKLHWALFIFPVWSWSIFAAMLLFGYQFEFLFGLFGLAIAPFLLGTSLYLLFQGHKEALVFSIAWLSPMVGVAILAMTLLGWVPNNRYTLYLINVGLLADVVLLSVAMSHRINLARREQGAAQAKLYELELRHSQQLESEVQKRTEQLRQSESELLRTNRAKDRLFSIIGHDLRGPMGALYGTLALLDKNHLEMETEDRADFLATTHRASRFLFDLLCNLLDWAKTQTQDIEVNAQAFDWVHQAQEIASVYQPLAQGKQVELKLDLPPSAWVVTDPALSATILRNLVHNALKFTPKGGEVVVGGRWTEAKDWEVEVRDQGVGMDAARLRSVLGAAQLEPGEDTDEETSSGLGLVLCRQLGQLLGTQLQAESEPGQGSRFWFQLPGAGHPPRSFERSEGDGRSDASRRALPT